MKKIDLLMKYQALSEEKHVELDGIYGNSTKEEIENAIACLECPDELMRKYLVIIELKYPNTYKAIIKAGYLTHSYNRLYVYNTARMLLA